MSNPDPEPPSRRQRELEAENERLRRQLRRAGLDAPRSVEAEDRLPVLLDSATDYAILTTDAGGLVTSWNEGAWRLLGWHEDETLGRDIRIIFTPEDRDAGVPEREREQASNAGRAEDERWHVRKDGSRFWASGIAMPLRDGAGGFLKILRDRTEHLHAERNQTRRLDQLKALAEAARAIMGAPDLPGTLGAITDAARTIIGAHQAVCSMTRGPDWSQAINAVALSDKYAAWTSYESMPDGSGIYAWVCEGNRTIRMTQSELEAHPHWRGFGEHAREHPPMRGWLATALTGSDGRNLGLIQLSDKVEGEFDEADESIIVQLAQFAASAIERATAEEDRRRGAEALRRLNETLEERVEARTAERNRVWAMSRDLLAVMGVDGYLKAVNPAWEATLGFDEATLLSRPFPQQVHPDDHAVVGDAVVRLQRGETIQRLEDRLRHADGSWRWIAWTLVPGDDVFYAVGRDITAEKTAAAQLDQAQDALRQAQKMEAVGQLTGGVAHDFNNLLTIIRSSVDFLQRPDLPEERRRRYIAAISETVDRAAKLTSQLLAFARRQALRPEVFDVAARIGSLGQMLRTVAGSRIRITTEILCDPCFVEADVVQFETALVNMAVNARDAMAGEGRLTIRVAEAVAIPPLRAHGARPGRFVAVSLADTGSGIPPDRLDHIFEPFFTTKAVGQGTGLGLSQVFGFAKQSGGDVEVESEVGRGSTFTLYLPRVEGAEAGPAAPAADAPEAEHGQGLRVLLVEDNPEVGSFSSQLLRDLGYETVWATGAGEALEILGGGPDRFDVVFSDVVMPGMSGIELAHEIERRLPDLPVVLTSGYSHVLAQEGSHGFELLQKPYAAEEVSRVLRRVLRARRKGVIASG
jgi:PAS domain S-box-containing protein